MASLSFLSKGRSMKKDLVKLSSGNNASRSFGIGGGYSGSDFSVHRHSKSCLLSSPGKGSRERGQSTILDRFGARPTRLAWPLGWKSLGRDRRTDGRSRWRGNQTHAPPGRTKNGETCCEGYQPLCREVQVTA